MRYGRAVQVLLPHLPPCAVVALSNDAVLAAGWDTVVYMISCSHDDDSSAASWSVQDQGGMPIHRTRSRLPLTLLMRWLTSGCNVVRIAFRCSQLCKRTQRCQLWV